MLSTSSTSLSFLAGGGDMGERIRATDWSATPLGRPETWPGSLRTLVQVMLRSQQPMFIAWGEQRTMLYNDGYAPMCANKHPRALGRPFAEVWADIIEAVGPIMDAAYAGVPTYMDDIKFLMTRNGRQVETLFSFGYTPVHDDTDRVAGMFCTALEITAKVNQGKLSGVELNRLREMLEQAPSFMAVFSGPEHVFEIANAAYVQLIGHRDVIGKSVHEALPDIEGQGFYELLDGVYSTGQPFVGRALPVVIQRQPDAAPEQLFIDFIYQPIFAPSGQVSGIFVQGHDISDRKRAEIAAAMSEARFRQLAQSMPNHVWTALPSGSLNWFNDQVYAYSGASAGELDGDRWGAIVHPDDIAAAAATWAAALANSTPYKAEFRLRQSNGGYRWHIARATAVFGADGVVSYWVGTNTDIEDQKSAEMALRESELRVKLALAAAEMGVWECKVVNGQLVDLAGDPRALVLLGGKPGAASDFDAFVSRIHPEDRAGLAPAAMRALDPSGDGVLDIEYRIRPHDDTPEHWVQARAQAVRDNRGEIRLVGTVRDITQVKDAQERQMVLSGELQHRIKNTLAMVSAIATQTLRGDDIADRRASFSARLEALASAHSMLMATTWNSASLHSVLDGALAPHRSDGERIEIEGPDLELSPRQALSMALTIHELATNAAKYGALSVDSGSIRITWSVDASEFRFLWEEIGGPPVSEPASKGFGSRLITRVLAADFAGIVGIDYRSEGVVCSLVAPTDSVKPRAATAALLQNRV